MLKTLLSLILALLLAGFTNIRAQEHFRTDMDSVIAYYVEKVNADSIQSYMQSLEDMGTRFCLADNRRDVSMWIKNKFLEFGYPEVRLDSFLFDRWYGGNFYRTWQYNVVCNMQGHERPDEIYIVGGHHDAIVPSSSNPFVIAPGADDNASGTAAAIEIARIMKAYDYHPEATIKFITFAAEELGLHGSWHYANTAQAEGKDIKMMLNNDMISYCTLPEEQWTIRFVKYPNSQWVTDLAHYITNNFTILNTFETTQYMQQSDSYPFYANGYHTIFFIEDQFTPFYHTVNDLVSTTNKDYAAEVVKISLGMLIHENGPGLSTGVHTPDQTHIAQLYQNYPNPFRSKTSIKYFMKDPGWLDMKVYDASNRVVAVLHDGWHKPGTHWATFSATTLPPGVYFCRMQTAEATLVIKLMVSR